ncbi:MAG: universal stress protein [Desulforhopalus sp.]|nr:universal stress protein [Desulforhopalus sp.]
MKNKPKISTILYASDLGEQTRPVFRHALALAKLYDAKIIMMHVVEPMGETAKSILSAYISKEFSDDMLKDSMDGLLTKMKDRLRRFFEEECEEEKVCSNVKEIIAVTGSPSEEILRVSEEEKADIIVLGKSTRKVRGIRVMGSTARRVSRMATVPVLIVPNY